VWGWGGGGGGRAATWGLGGGLIRGGKLTKNHSTESRSNRGGKKKKSIGGIKPHTNRKKFSGKGLGEIGQGSIMEKKGFAETERKKDRGARKGKRKNRTRTTEEKKALLQKKGGGAQEAITKG